MTAEQTHRAPRRSTPSMRRGRRAALVVGSFALASAPVNAHAQAPNLWWSFGTLSSCPGTGVNVNMPAKSQWYNAPRNGYVVLKRQRQATDGEKTIVTAQKTLSTKNTSYEGNRGRFVWTAFTPTTQVTEWQQWTRSVYVLTFKKDDAFRDTVVSTKRYATRWCVQGE